ncbi:Rieske 2Fe-2S domain-containing protein, partial [Bordetella hinzii]|nr:Rieske 2Fe-2S domain-containing protein [Bordetella hinzii]
MAVKEVAVRMFDKTFREVTQASHSPGFIYHDPDVLAREEAEIFRRDWLCLAREDELAKPGDYMALRVLRDPVLLCRDEAGTVRAYANMCLHRGVEIATGKGNAEEFT